MERESERERQWREKEREREREREPFPEHTSVICISIFRTHSPALGV